MRSATTDRQRPGRPRLAWLFLAWGLVLGTVLSLGGCGGGADQREAADGGPGGGDFGANQTFPVPPEIRPNVDFWRHVYGIWGRGQVAFHDDEHMGVIYEVVRLPGALHESYTPDQKQFVEARKRYYQGRTAELERKVRARAPLSPDDRQLLAKFEGNGGAAAVYGASERVRAQRGLRERFRRGLEISGRYDRAFRETMRANGVPEDLAYLPHVESSFQTNARSSVGAAGVWQFMPSTGRSYMNVNAAVDDRLDPIVCANGAARYLSQAHGRLRSWPLAITSYNHGVGGMAKAKASHGDHIGRIVRDYNGPAFKFASRNFYSEFMAAREVARNAPRYFPEGVRYEEPWPHDRLVLRSSMPAQHLASHYGTTAGTLAGLNLHWRDGARDGRTHLPAGTTVWLPAGSTKRVAGHPPGYSGGIAAARAPSSGTRGGASGSGSSLGGERVIAALAPVARPVRSEPAAPRAGRAGAVTVADAEPTDRNGREDRAPVSVPRRAKPQTKAEAKPKPAALAQSAAKPGSKPAAKPKSARPGESKPGSEAAKVAKSAPKAQAKGGKVAKSPEKPQTKDSKSAKADAKKTAKGQSKYHVVKPQETLYKVATMNGLSVAELRRLNKMGPKDNNVRPGQKLKVDI